jgi:ketosteroid isomerase-like protein
MGEQENRAVVQRMVELAARGDLDGIAENWHEDIVVEWPQSGERIQGKENAYQVLRNYPEGMPKPTNREIRAGGNLVVSESTAEYPDGSVWYWTNIFEIEDGKVIREVDYFSQAFEAPDWRAQWVTKL